MGRKSKAEKEQEYREAFLADLKLALKSLRGAKWKRTRAVLVGGNSHCYKEKQAKGGSIQLEYEIEFVNLVPVRSTVSLIQKDDDGNMAYSSIRERAVESNQESVAVTQCGKLLVQELAIHGVEA